MQNKLNRQYEQNCYRDEVNGNITEHSSNTRNAPNTSRVSITTRAYLS